MARVSVDLFYVRLSLAGGAYGWGPFKSEADASQALQMLSSSNLPGSPFIDKETHEMDAADAKNITWHDGQFRGRGRRVTP